jgi:dihydrofolate synthase / folylpolyglutamate synthase
MSYSELLNKLFNVNLFSGIKLGLQNCSAIDEALNFPSKKFRSVHIAGTNGKGSVSTKIAKALELSEFKTGLYTSPHISTFRERIKINSQMITEIELQKCLKELFDLVEKQNISATFFELTTMLAFQHFVKNQVSIAVLEVGLGGTYDATNIVLPELSIITSISMDHAEILGNSIEEITKQKAGIIKPGVPVVIGPRVPVEIIHDIAKKKNSPYVVVEGSFANFDEENTAIAKKALEILDIPLQFIQKGIICKPTCRIEIFNKEFLLQSFKRCPEALILDVAHNPDGLHQLFQFIHQQFTGKKIRAICGISKNKDIHACLSILKKNTSSIHLIEAKNGRSASVQILKEILVNSGMSEKLIFTGKTIRESITEAFHKAKEHGEIIVACGTFFIMNEVRTSIGIVEDFDTMDMNERSLSIQNTR